jgi:hypothetical protein
VLDQVRRRLSYANVLSTVAVFLALGGTSYAAVSITGRDVENSSLTGHDVEDASLTGRDIRNSSLTGLQVKHSSLGTTDIANGALLSKDFKAGELPAGAQGPSGERGDAGETGSTGAQGVDGLDGAAGTAGAPGADGLDGAAGTAGAPGTGLTSGRLNDVAVNDPPKHTFFGSAMGVANGNATESVVQTLSPNVATTGRNLAVRLTLMPCDDGLGSATSCGTPGSVDVALRVDGVTSALQCTITTPGKTCDSGAATVSIPAAAQLSIMITGDLLGVPGHVTYDRDMLFGFQMSPAA